MSGLTGKSSVLSADGCMKRGPQDVRVYGYKMESIYVYQK